MQHAKDRTRTASKSPTISQADEFLRRARTTPVYRTEPLPAVAAAALGRLERAFTGTAKAVMV
ncbi:hypothetical protein [Streptomyces griseofuscus]|uniref:hypothetical protein n=1 Tax=Streptomyces griseofuscus TaxID=146922 RepID=UPI00367F636F